MSRLATVTLVLGAISFSAVAQGPDVIVGDLFDLDNYGASGGIHAFAVGTESCNIGNQNLTWDANTNLHPVIAQNMYRLKNGRFEQIGQSWLKHGFYALSNNLCSPCQTGSPNGTWLGIGCSDPYTANLNGAQGNLGPRNEVNASTGYFPYPPSGTYPNAAATIGRRLQVLTTDLSNANNPGALYFVEGHYVHPEDAAAGNKHNNASYRPVTVNGTNFVTLTGFTHQQSPAIQAWKDTDPTVQIFTVDVPGDGRFLVAFKGTPAANNLYHYEYAVQNLNSDRSMGSFSVELWPGANPSGIGFRSVPHHSGEPYSNTPWTSTYTPGSLFPGTLTWATTPHSSNPNAHALRWGSMFNFWFDCDQLPGNAAIGIFKPGSPTTMAVPTFCPPKRPAPGVPAPYSLVTSTSYDYVNISTTGSQLAGGDDVAYTVPLPFSFPLYGQAQTSIVISTNGYLTRVGQDGTLYNNHSLPNAAIPSGIIAGYWDDLDCIGVGSVRYQTVGTAPNQRFVVYWNAVHLGTSQPLQFEIILEPTGNIVSTVVTAPNNAGSSATRGIESWDNTAALQYSFNTPSSAFSQSTIRYEVTSGVPVSSNLFYSGSLGGGLFRLVYVGGPNTPILTMASVNPGPTNLGGLGVLPIDLTTSIGLLDYFGILTGFPNPGAITNTSCDAIEAQFWINPATLPTGVVFYIGGIGFATNPAQTPNGWFDIAPVLSVSVP